MPKIMSSNVANKEYRKRLVKHSSLFVPENVIVRMTDHADAGLAENREIMGLIMGSVYFDEHGEYAVVEDVATSVLDATEIGVRFNRDHLEELFDSIDSCKGEHVVGWYHSHLGIGCYLSEIDIKTHEGIFGRDTGFAIVIDPMISIVVPFICSGGNPLSVKMVIME